MTPPESKWFSIQTDTVITKKLLNYFSSFLNKKIRGVSENLFFSLNQRFCKNASYDHRNAGNNNYVHRLFASSC